MLPDRVPSVPHSKSTSECYIEFYPAIPALSRGEAFAQPELQPMPLNTPYKAH